MNLKFIPALAATAALAVAGCGSDDGNGSSSKNPGGNGTDRAFVAAMVPHHKSAVAMAQIAQDRGNSAFVRRLADDIIRTQTAEIATMQREDEGLEAAGVKPGSLGMDPQMMGMNMDPAMLKTAKPFDRKFMKMMIPHHQSAVTMAKAELAKGGDPELKSLAQDIVTAQEREIAAMRRQLAKS